MKSNYLFAAIAGSFFALLFSPTVSTAADWSLTPRAETGVEYYHFQQTPTIAYDQPESYAVTKTEQLHTTGTVTLPSKDFQAWMPILGAGLSLVVNRFFVDASVQTALNGSASDSGAGNLSAKGFDSFDFGQGRVPLSLTQVGDTQSQGSADFDRLEYALSAGYAVTDRFAVYAGWKWAATRFDVRSTSDLTLITQATIDNTSIGQRSIGVSSINRGTQRARNKYDFEQNGPFVGAAYSWDFEQRLKGALTINAAVAYLNGEFKNIDTEVTQCWADGGCVLDATGGQLIGFKGSSTAFTLGVSWRGETSIKGLTYLLGVNGYSYHFGADSLQNDLFHGTDGGDVTETVLNFKVGLAYAF